MENVWSILRREMLVRSAGLSSFIRVLRFTHSRRLLVRLQQGAVVEKVNGQAASGSRDAAVRLLAHLIGRHIGHEPFGQSEVQLERVQNILKHWSLLSLDRSLEGNPSDPVEIHGVVLCENAPDHTWVTRTDLALN